MEKRELSYTVDGNADWCSQCGKHTEFPQKTKNRIAFFLAIPLLAIYPKNPETPIKKNLCNPMFIAALFTISMIWKQPECPSVDEGI